MSWNVGPAKKGDTQSKELWSRFWGRDRDIRKVYSNDDRVRLNLMKAVDVGGKRILEVGGGSGRDSLEMARGGAICFVLDYTTTALDLVRSQCEAGSGVPRLICGDAFKLPIKDCSVDVVFHQGLMEHFREPDGLLEENRRVLKDGGHLLVDVPQRYHVYTILKQTLIWMNRWFAGWETQYSIGELEDIMRSHRMDPVLSYGDWMSPSIFYRSIREAFFLFGLELPMYPWAPFRRIRLRAKKWLMTRRISFYSFHVIGVIGKKRER